MSQDVTLFHSAPYVEASDVEPSKNTLPFMSLWKNLMMLKSLDGKDLEEIIPSDQIENRCEVCEGNEE